MLFGNVDGPALVSCILTDTVVFEDCDDPDVIGCTFDYSSGGRNLKLDTCTSSRLRNNVFVNTATDTGILVVGSVPDSDYNCWYPKDRPAEGAHSINSDPEFASGYYFTNEHDNPIVGEGVAVSGYDADFNGWWRHTSTPTDTLQQHGAPPQTLLRETPDMIVQAADLRGQTPSDIVRRVLLGAPTGGE